MLPVSLPITDNTITLPTTDQLVVLLLCTYMAVFLFEKVFKIIKYYRESSKNDDEVKAKTLSRNYLLQIKNDVAYIKIKSKDTHTAIMKEHDGSKLIYNKGLENYVKILNNNIINLTEAIKNLAK